jgi:MFS family permease
LRKQSSSFSALRHGEGVDLFRFAKFAEARSALMIGFGLWVLHMGLTQGILAILVIDTAPPELRGIAFGAFNVVVGSAMLVATMIAGGLWDRLGPGDLPGRSRLHDDVLGRARAPPETASSA